MQKTLIPIAHPNPCSMEIRRLSIDSGQQVAAELAPSPGRTETTQKTSDTVPQINEIRIRNTHLCCALLRAIQSVSERGLAEGCHRNKAFANAMQCGLPIRDSRQNRNFYLKNAWAHRRAASPCRRRGKAVDRRRSRFGDKAARSAGGPAITSANVRDVE
ncbi:hypothetical protein [Burkholderia ambifaria]|jgi:hypothetical protein|uniref:hypothetical protein n=1 Tax=Burkholderia ambifaria TaxID=152480 RepID=UPI00158A9388|nr:hypothetical protein [Burkholderia ambifaria]